MNEYLIPINDAQAKQLNGWIEEIREHEHGAFKWAAALYRLRESGLWKAKARSWSAFCFEEFGYTRQRVSELCRAAEAVESLKLISETTGEEVKMPTSIAEAARKTVVSRAPLAADNENKKNQISSSNETLATQSVEKLPNLPLSSRAFAQEVWECLDWITHHETLTLPGIKRAQATLSHADKLRNSNVLSGMETVMSPPGKRRPTLKEVQEYCILKGIPESDAEWFLAKMDGNGWMNGTQPVKNWMGTLLQKKKEGILGSQIEQRRQYMQNPYGQPKGPTLSQKITKEVVDDVNRFLDKNNL